MMYDVLAAALLADHLNLSRQRRKRVPDAPADTETPWARVFAWHRRKPDLPA